MRLFLASPRDKQTSRARTALETAYGPELPVFVHTPELAWASLPAHCLVESHDRPTALLLSQLSQHGFKILSVVENPLNILAALLSHDGVLSGASSSSFSEYAVSDAMRGRLLPMLEWSRVDGALALRPEDLAFSRSVEIERLRHHCGEFVNGRFSDPANSPLAPHEDPDFWRTRFPIELALQIHDAHAGLFAALGYFSPMPENPADHEADSSAETRRLRHQLRAREVTQQRLEKELRVMRKHRAKTVTELLHRQIRIEAGETVTWRYHHLVHGVGIGKHLYRAWQVLIGNRHYRQPAPANKKVAGGERVLPDHLKGYQAFTLGDLEVRFHLEALHDNRGTGRVATQLLNGLKALQTPPASSTESSRRVVHFFAAPHWGPEELPERTCMLIHDVIPSITPGYPEESLAIFEKRCKNALRHADKIITISATSARDISRLYTYPENKITVIHNGVSGLPVSKNPVTKLPDAPFVAYVGAGDIHKNLGLLLEALCLPAARHVHLVMVGENTHYSHEVALWGIGDRVHFLGRISDDELGYVLKQAKAFVFPSYYEGFGLPPLEAALLGTPSICSRRPAMTELLAGAALFADHESPDDWAACMHLLTTSPDFAREIGQLAREKAERLQWDTTCRAYLKEFQTMA